MIKSTPADEGRHEPDSGLYWNESWYFDFSRADGTGGYVRLGLYPNQQVAWYWAYLVSSELGLVVVRDHEVPLSRADALEVRADGLWAECVCETPMEHWGLGLEAFGVRLDEPGDAYRGEIGERVPVGLDLEWEAATPVYDYPYPDGHPGAHYEHAGVVHGELLVGQERIDFEGRGERDHSWGDRDWWVWGWHWTSFQVGNGFLILQQIGAPAHDQRPSHCWVFTRPFHQAAFDQLRRSLVERGAIARQHIARIGAGLAQRFAFEARVQIIGG